MAWAATPRQLLKKGYPRSLGGAVPRAQECDKVGQRETIFALSTSGLREDELAWWPQYTSRKNLPSGDPKIGLSTHNRRGSDRHWVKVERQATPLNSVLSKCGRIRPRNSNTTRDGTFPGQKKQYGTR